MSNDTIARLMAEAMAKKMGQQPKTQVAESKPAAEPTKPEPAPVIASVPAKVEPNPFLVVDNNQLLTSDSGEASERSEPAEQHLSSETVLYSAEQLARVNTDGDELEPKDRHEKTELVKAAEMAKDLVLKDSSSVRHLCDAIDTLIESHDRLVGPSLITLRGYVQTLMVTLKARPEFDEIIIDKDVRNVMRFIRTVRETALATRETKMVKKAVRETKKAKSAPVESAFANAFSQVMKAQMKP